MLPPNTTLLQRTTCLQSRPQRTRRRGSQARQPAERPAYGESLRILHGHRKAELRRDVSPANVRRAPLTDAQLRTDDVLPPNTTLLQRTPCLQSRAQRTRRRGSPARQPAERPAHGESLRIPHGPPQGRAPSRRFSSKRSSRPSHGRPDSEQTTCFHQTQPSYRGRRACKAVPSVPSSR